MRKVLLLIAVLTVVLAGCRVETNVILDIEEDGSALVGAEVGYDEEFRELLEQSGADPDDLFSDLPAVGDDVVTIERTEGDMTYTGVASNVPDLSTVAAESTELETFSSFSYEFDEDGATLAATVAADDAALAGGDLGELGIDPSQLTDEFFSANVVVTMPGEVTEHNADVVRSDGTLVWKIPLSGAKQINATSSFGTSSANLLLILLVALLLLGIIVVIVATVVSRRQSQQAVATAAATGGAATAPAADGGSESTGGAAEASATAVATAEETEAPAEPVEANAAAEPASEDAAAEAASESASESADTGEADSPPSGDDQPETT